MSLIYPGTPNIRQPDDLAQTPLSLRQPAGALPAKAFTPPPMQWVPVSQAPQFEERITDFSFLDLEDGQS